MNKVFSLTVVLLIMLLLPITVSLAQTPSVPDYINFQGRILDSAGNPIFGDQHTLVFRLFDVPSGGSALWTSPPYEIVITGDPLFNLLLQLPMGFFDTYDSLFLEIVVNGETQTPRTPLASVGYARRVGTVNRATGGTIYGDVSIQSNLIVSDSVGIGTLSPQAKLDIVGDLKVSGNIIGSTPWTPFPFATGYNDYGFGWQSVQYRKIGDIVYLRGTIHKADENPIPNGAIIGTFPLGFRPPANLRFILAFSGATITGAEIFPSGDILLFFIGGAWGSIAFLDGISFSTSQ